MDLVDLIVLSLVQGITEFLPVSSSAHLILYPIVTGRPDQGLAIDVATHVGTLVAVCLFFWREVSQIPKGLSDLASGRRTSAAAHMVFMLMIATIPVVFIGVIFKVGDISDALRNAEVIGWATVIGAILLALADRAHITRNKAESWTARDAWMMGAAQALAAIPGTSRSGITMTMARWLGFSRADAARLALLMAVPTIALAGLAETASALGDDTRPPWSDLGIAAVLSCLAALAALSLMMRFFRASGTMTWFVVYRMALGMILLFGVYVAGWFPAA